MHPHTINDTHKFILAVMAFGLVVSYKNFRTLNFYHLAKVNNSQQVRLAPSYFSKIFIIILYSCVR